MSSLTGETYAGAIISFSYEAYADAMERYNLADIEHVVKDIEAGKAVKPEIASFFRDFTILQELDHPDFDRGMAIGNLATRIEIATGEITPEELERRDVDIEIARMEYELVFGSKPSK